MLALTITRSQSQKPPHKDHGCNGQKPTITAMVAYAPVSRRSCSRSQKKATSDWAGCLLISDRDDY
ncbi:hypothetical protein B4585_08875 [Lacticaseibacillus paracasei]|nr:hypothetical protein B4585_08875 [Lacticaseibacillus paracasei]